MLENESIVSIIIPCYNQGQYLAEALDSVIAQTYSYWECIVVDDGSSDNSREVALAYAKKDKRISYLYQDNQGVSAARNNAIKNSKGKYILPLDGDDMIAPTYVEKAVSYLMSHEDVKLVYCKARLFGEQNGVWNLPKYTYEMVLWKNIIFCTAMFRRSDYDKTKGYNVNMKKGLEDWDFWLSLLSKEDVVYQIDEILFYYRIKQVSRNADIDYSINRELNKQIVRNHSEIYARYLEDIINFHQAENLLHEAVEAKACEIRMSTPYRLGKIILTPLRWLKRK